MSVALVIQHAKRMRHVVLSSVACLAAPYLTVGTFVQELLNIKCACLFSRQLLSETFLILKINADIIIIIIIIFINCNWVSPGGSGYVTCIQNMKLVTNKFKSGGLHKKHVVATWNLGNHLSICL